MSRPKGNGTVQREQLAQPMQKKAFVFFKDFIILATSRNPVG